MVYIEVQDKKKKKKKKKNLKFGMKKNELQSVSFDWYSIDWKLHISKKSANVKSP